MKKLLCTAVLAAIGSWVFSQEHSIAIFPFEDMEKVLNSNQSFMFYDEFSNEFVKRNAGRFTVVERKDYERLFTFEADFQLSDYSEKVKTAEMERVLNGTRILSGRIGMVDNKIRIIVSLYTYPELVRLPNGTSLSVANTTELFNKIPELVQKMQSEIVSGNINPSPLPSPSLDARLNTIGISVGSSFAAPFVIVSAHGTIAPIRYAFLEIGFDFGLLSGDLDVSFYSMYPFAHLAFFLPFSEIVGSYIGAGAGYMMVRYTFPEGKYSENIFAADIVAGFNILNMFDISYTLRTNFSGISNKISVGLTYRF